MEITMKKDAYLTSMGMHETVISAFVSICLCKYEVIRNPHWITKKWAQRYKYKYKLVSFTLYLHKIHVVHPVKVIARQN